MVSHHVVHSLPSQERRSTLGVGDGPFFHDALAFLRGFADPTVGAWVLNYRDITASKQQEEALHAADHSASTSPLQDATGTMIGVIGICTENTAPIPRETVRMPNEDLLLSALKNTPLTLYQQDQNLRYRWVHQPFAIFPVGNLIGKTDADVIQPEEAASLTQIKQQVLTAGSTRAVSRLQVNAILSKPFDLDQLEQVIQHLLPSE